MFAINPYLWISLELWVFLWSTTCTDHFGLSKNIVRVGKPLHRLAAVFCIFFCAVFGWFFGCSSVQTRSCTAWFKIWFRPPPPYRSLCSDAWRAGEAIQRLELCGAQLVARFGGFEFRASLVDKLSTLKF